MAAAQAPTSQDPTLQALLREVRERTNQMGAQLDQKAEANSALVNEHARWDEANNPLTSIERLTAPAQP